MDANSANVCFIRSSWKDLVLVVDSLLGSLARAPPPPPPGVRGKSLVAGDDVHHSVVAGAAAGSPGSRASDITIRYVSYRFGKT
jgi:hypothetical protein